MKIQTDKKTSISVGALIIFCFQFSLHAEQNPSWHDMPSAPTAPAELLKHDDIFFINDSTGWLVTRSGGIYKTIDGGINWVQKLQEDAYFRCVGFINEEKGFVGNLHGEDGNVLYKTLDGGESWEIVENFTGSTPEGLCGLWVYDENTIYGAGRVFGPAYLIRSFDGGESWESIDLNEIAGMAIDLYFWSADSGILIGGTNRSSALSKMQVMFTPDSGNTWENIYEGERSFEWGWKIVFPEPNIGYISIQRASYSSPSTEYFLKSTNGGSTWEDLPFWGTDTLNPSVYSANGIGFVDSMTGWMGSWRPFQPTLMTEDGGQTWNEVSFGQNLNRFRILSDTLAYAVGRRAYKFISGEVWDFPPTIDDLPQDLFVDEDDEFSYEFVAYDPDYQPFTYEATTNSGFMEAALEETGFGNMKLLLELEENWYGNAIVYITLNDGFYSTSDTSFITINPINDPPGSFSLISPSVEEQGLPVNPQLMWSTSLDIDYGDSVLYNLLVSEYSNFSEIEYSALEISDTIYVTTLPLTNDTRYYWKIEAFDLDSAITTSSTSSFVVGLVSTFSIPVSYSKGWNLIGLPLFVEDAFYVELYPEAVTGTLYGFNGNYNPALSLTPGNGYWLRFEREGLVFIEGNFIDALTLQLAAGWNLISGPSETISMDNLIDSAGIIIPGTIYGWGEVYSQDTVFIPGKSYWIKTSDSGEIILSSASDQNRGNYKRYLSNSKDHGKLSFTNNDHFSFDLFLGKKLTQSERLEYSMPPKPPHDGFDVRFGDDTRYASNDAEIMLQNAKWPIKIEFNAQGSNFNKRNEWKLTLPKTTEIITLRNGHPVLIYHPTNKFILTKSTHYPSDFSLFQNYPNPFNPITTIRYDLPEQALVTLIIYNLMGREIAQLVNTTQEAGYRSVQWDGTNAFGKPVSAGVYLYQIRTVNFFQTKKMVFLK